MIANTKKNTPFEIIHRFVMIVQDNKTYFPSLPTNENTSACYEKYQ
jgi:hypothetical protein